MLAHQKTAFNALFSFKFTNFCGIVPTKELIMLVQKYAAHVIVGMLLVSLSWLGYCAMRDFAETSSQYHKND